MLGKYCSSKGMLAQVSNKPEAASGSDAIHTLIDCLPTSPGSESSYEHMQILLFLLSNLWVFDQPLLEHTVPNQICWCTMRGVHLLWCWQLNCRNVNYFINSAWLMIECFRFGKCCFLLKLQENAGRWHKMHHFDIITKRLAYLCSFLCDVTQSFDIDIVWHGAVYFKFIQNGSVYSNVTLCTVSQ